MKQTIRLGAAAALLAVLVAAPATAARAPGRDRYRATHPATSRIDRIVVRRDCLEAEDSAFHIKLRIWDPNHSRAVIGCKHRGY